MYGESLEQIPAYQRAVFHTAVKGLIASIAPPRMMSITGMSGRTCTKSVKLDEKNLFGTQHNEADESQ
jgi:hypothetical protein